MGAMLRLSACFGVDVDVIEPTGFPMDDKRMRRAGMDYIDLVRMTAHASFDAFIAARGAQPSGRLILLDVRGRVPYTAVQYAEDDTIMVGRESDGVPAHVYEACDLQAFIPMRSGARSLNVALSAAIGLSEALRQIHS
jgi:tRNA (cytidine/uridine-2'-O-)-methyltransferase